MKNIEKLILFLIFVIIVYSCDSPTESNISFDTDEIYELVFRDQFNNNYSPYTNHGDIIDTTYQIYFICIYEAINSGYDFVGERIDPSDNFLKRFDGFHKKVKKISDSEYLPYGRIQDKITKERGMYFYIGPIKWLSSTSAEVESGYHEAIASADCFSYKLYKKNGTWHIYYKTIRWIS